VELCFFRENNVFPWILGNKRSFGELDDDEDDIFGSKKVPVYVPLQVFVCGLLSLCLSLFFFSSFWGGGIIVLTRLCDLKHANMVNPLKTIIMSLQYGRLLSSRFCLV